MAPPPQQNKFNQKNVQDGLCPNCGNKDISEVTGWCLNHNRPQTDGKTLVFCPDHKGDELITRVRDARYCWWCDSLFDNKTVVSLSEYSGKDCPVGTKQTDLKEGP